MEQHTIFDFQSIQIRLLQDVGKLPAGITMQLPEPISFALIRRRLARPVGDAYAQPDVTFDDDDMQHAGIELDPAWLAAAV